MSKHGSLASSETDGLRERLIGAAHNACDGKAPDSLSIRWSGFGDEGQIDDVWFGSAHPSAKRLDEHYPLEEPAVSGEVLEMAHEFCFAWMDDALDSAARDVLETNNGGYVEIVVGLADGAALLIARQAEESLKESKEAGCDAHLTRSEAAAPNGKGTLRLGGNPARSLWSFADDVAERLFGQDADARRSCAGRLPKEGVLVRADFSGEGDTGVLDDVQCLTTSGAWADDDFRERWRSAFPPGGDEDISWPEGVDEAAINLADAVPFNWEDNDGGTVEVEFTLPIDPYAEGAEIGVVRRVRLRKYLDDEIERRTLPPLLAPAPNASPAP